MCQSVRLATDLAGHFRALEGRIGAMIPRFSIRVVLCVTAFVAITLAAFLYPLSAWVPIAFLSSVGVIGRWAVVAAQQTTEQAVFARGAAVLSVLYLGCALGGDFDYGAWRMPHHYLVDAYMQLFPDAEADEELMRGYDDRFELVKFKSRHLYGMARGVTAVVFGLVGGSLALWRYRVSDRGEAAQVPGGR